MRRLRPYRTMLIGTMLIGAVLAAATVASADNAWNGYHWQSDNLTPTVVDKTSSALYDVSDGVSEWAFLDDGVTPRSDIQPTLTTANKGDITVTEAFSPFWLGLARIFIDDGHITKGEVKLNTRLLDNYGANAADHVLCQELGHVLGLTHNRNEDNTCMNDQATLGSATSPNSHDTVQLNLIYDGHTDVVDGGTDDGGGGGGGGPPCDRNPDHPNCQAQNGHWITVHVFPIP